MSLRRTISQIVATLLVASCLAACTTALPQAIERADFLADEESVASPEQPAASPFLSEESCLSPWTAVIAGVGLCVGGGPVGCVVAIPAGIAIWYTVQRARCR
jgi:hypothetical protein